MKIFLLLIFVPYLIGRYLSKKIPYFYNNYAYVDKDPMLSYVIGIGSVAFMDLIISISYNIVYY